MKKSDCERLLGRKISNEEFKNNRMEIEDEALTKFCPIDPFDIDDNDEFTAEDLMSILNEDDFRKMRGMTQEQIVQYERNLCKELGVPYPPKF